MTPDPIRRLLILALIGAVVVAATIVTQDLSRRI